MSKITLKAFPKHIQTLIVDELEKEVSAAQSKAASLRSASPRDERAIAAYEKDARDSSDLKDRFLSEMR